MKKTIVLVSIGSLLCISSVLMPMHAGLNFSRFCKFVNVGLAVGPSFLGAYKTSTFDATAEASLDDADQLTTALAREQLKRVGVENPEEISIKRGDPNNAQFNAFRAGIKTIVVPNNYCDFVANTAEPDTARRERGLQEARSIIQHEGNHIKNNDIQNSVLCLAMIPFISHPAFKLGASAIQKLYKFKAPKSNLRMFGRNVGAGWLKMTINGHLFGAYSKDFEQRADDGVVDSQGLVNFLHNTYYSIPDEAKREFVFGMDIYHPHPLKRIAKFEERAKVELEAEKVLNRCFLDNMDGELNDLKIPVKCNEDFKRFARIAGNAKVQDKLEVFKT